MNFRTAQRDDIDLNITPLIDVVFLLLIFFMVSTTFERKSEISITLPEAAEEKTEAQVDAVTVAIDADGRVYVDDRPLVNSRLPTIRDALGETAADMDDPMIIINADAEATHQAVVRVMDAARQLSLSRITFTTRLYEEEQP